MDMAGRVENMGHLFFQGLRISAVVILGRESNRAHAAPPGVKVKASVVPGGKGRRGRRVGVDPSVQFPFLLQPAGMAGDYPRYIVPVVAGAGLQTADGE